MLRRSIPWCCLLLILGAHDPASAYVMNEVPLEHGHTVENEIRAPLVDTAGVGGVVIGEIEAAYDADGYVVRLMTKSLLTSKPKYKKPHYKLDPSVDLAALFAEALRSEAGAMGFADGAGATHDRGWRVSGTLHDIAMDIRPSGGGFGPLLFYGYLDVELEVQDAGGEVMPQRYQHYSLSHHFNAGWGVQDEAKKALALFLVEAAQEVVARLNREVFHAPPHSGIQATLDQLKPNGGDMENELRSIRPFRFALGRAQAPRNARA